MDRLSQPAENYCRNCESTVSAEFARVMGVRGDGTVECCVHCEDMVRRNGVPDQSNHNRAHGTRTGAGD